MCPSEKRRGTLQLHVQALVTETVAASWSPRVLYKTELCQALMCRFIGLFQDQQIGQISIDAF